MKFHFVSGLPHSGSPLLVNILGQNPRFQVTGISPLLPTLLAAREYLDEHELFKAWPGREKHTAKLGMLRGAIEGFYTYSEKPVVLDKNRAWPAHIELIEEALGISPKIICAVRDVRDILATFEKFYRRNKGQRRIPAEKNNLSKFQTVAQRCSCWCENDMPVGLALTAMRDAIDRGKSACLHFVEFERLTAEPQQTLEGIYSFLGEEPFKHSFDSVEQITHEDDQVPGFEDLDTNRTKVAPLAPLWPDVLPAEVARRFSTLDLHFWRKIEKKK